MSRRSAARSRRVDDALSQLIDSILPPLPPSALGPDYSGDEEDALAAAEERRHAAFLERSWRIIESARDDATTTDNINNASDLIKRKLLRENASPDKAVRFSNLYSRLLTQPVLSQKWAILYLLYRLSEDVDGSRDAGLDEAERCRSPLMDDGNLENLLFRGPRNLPAHMRFAADDDGPAISSSVSQRGGRMERRDSLRPPQADPQQQRRPQPVSEGREVLAAPATAGATSRRPSMAKETASSDTVTPGDPEPGSETSKATESALLRDLPFVLQGLSSTNLEFTSSTTLKLPNNLPIPMISLLHTLAEPCLLYRGLAAFADGSEGGLITQALRAAIGDQLRSYLSLVATLEGEIRRALAAAADESDPKGTVKGAVTLKRCVVWTREATMALRLMSIIVEEAKNKKGGQLISLIHSFSSSHGDPFVGAFAERLLEHVTRPFYDMLRLWIYDGELSDPYKEFFVIEPEFRPSTDPRRIATSVWEDKYKLDEEMVPSIITQEFAKKVFLIGKSLNFIRYGCGDSAWVEAYSKEASEELRYGDTAKLEASIDEAYKTTMARLIALMDTKFLLFEHLRALKRYLLLGQGDFIAVLMESLAPNLDRPANSQYRHTLTAQLEHAIRSSNAQFDSPEVIRRLDARMLELSHGEIGWDCFTLEYKIDAPVDVVITPWASTQYLKVFNFLWRVKRVEFALGSTWRRCMTGARGVLGAVDDKVGADWKRARCVMAEMIHFICKLQNYILFEVIESSWDHLQASISKPGCTLDDLIEAHTKYLNSITHKGLLGSSTSRSSSSGKHSEESFLSQLHQILKIMLAYKDSVDGLYSFSVAEFTRRQELNARIETRTAQGRWGITEGDFLAARRGQSAPASATSSFNTAFGGGPPPDDPATATASPLLAASSGLSADDQMLAALQTRMRDLAADFRARLNVFLGDLAFQPDLDMRFLGVVMNFNDVYEPVRRKRTAATNNSTSMRERERSRRKAASTSGNNNGNGNGNNGPQSEGTTSSTRTATRDKDKERDRDTSTGQQQRGASG